jgi:hypothetical protein
VGASAPEAARSLVKIEAPLTSFRAYPRLEAVNQRFKKHGWMDVVTELADGRVLTVEVIAEITLVNGTVDVTRQDNDLVQLAGRLAKSPSFWVSRVEVVRRYARIGGVRVPVQVESTAHVRFAWPSAKTMTYRYETINGVPCDDH